MLARLRFAILIALLTAGVVLAEDAPAQGSSASDDKVAASADKPAKTSHWPRVRLGGIYVGAGYSHMSGPGYYPGYYGYRPWLWSGYAWPYAYDPFFYGPYMYPGFLTGYGYHPNMGEIKLRSDDKDAWVYLDGALAGKAEKLKSMWLEPGSYQLEVRSGDKKFGRKVYVLSGKTLKLVADLEHSEVRP